MPTAHRRRSRPPDAAAIDALVDEVADHAATWAATDAAARSDLLQQVINDTMLAQDGWLDAACAAKGLEPGSTEAGEELFAGIGTFVRMARLLRDSLRDIAKDGQALLLRARSARRRTAGCACRSSPTGPSTGSRSPRPPPRSGCSRA